MLSDSHSLHAVDVAATLYLPLRQRACHLSQHELTHLFTAALRDFLAIDSPPVRRAIGLASIVSVLEQSPTMVNSLLGARDGEFPSVLEKRRQEIQHREEARLWGRLECQFRKHQLILARHMCLASESEASQRDRRDCLLEYAFQSLGTGDQSVSRYRSLFSHSTGRFLTISEVCQSVSRYRSLFSRSTGSFLTISDVCQSVSR